MNLFYFLGYRCANGWPSLDSQANASTLASHRLRVELPARGLVGRGLTVHAISSKEELKALTVREGIQNHLLLIGKLSHPDAYMFDGIISVADNLITLAHTKSIPVVMDYTDDVVAIGDHRSRLSLELLLRSDTVVCASQALADRVALYIGEGANILVIPDPVEGSLRSAHASSLTAGHSLRLLWFGHPANLDPLLALLQPLDTLGRLYPIELEILTNLPAEQLLELQFGILSANLSYPIHFSEWNSQLSVFEALARSHVVLLPVDLNGPKAGASNNRLTEALWGGCFVVASPLASYAEFKDYSWQGEDLIEGIQWFLEHRQDADRQICMGQEVIAKSYTPDAITVLWEKTLQAIKPRHITFDSQIRDDEAQAGPRLNLGCGNHPLSDYLNIDILTERAGVQPDLCSDIKKLSLFPDNYADEILAVHVVEHFWRWEIEAILLEWIRVLRPGGKLILECPNLLSACKELLMDPDHAAGPGREGQRSMWVFYGDPSWQDPLMCHRWGYTPGSLIALLTNLGLDEAKQEPAMFKMREPRDMRITAKKPITFTPSPAPPSA